MEGLDDDVIHHLALPHRWRSPRRVADCETTEAPGQVEAEEVIMQATDKPVTKDDITDVDIEAVEFAVGMGCGAWDMVDPKEIIAAVLNLRKESDGNPRL